MKQIMKNTLILFVITLVSGALLAVVYELTKTPIGIAEQIAEDTAFGAVCPDKDVVFSDVETVGTELSDGNNRIIKVKEITDSNGLSKGYAIKASGKGYGGLLTMVVGVGTDGQIIGFHIISAQNESPGLGANCMSEEFGRQFIGKSNGITVSKVGAYDNSIDAISGATITTEGVTSTVNYVLEYVAEHYLTGGTEQ